MHDVALIQAMTALAVGIIFKSVRGRWRRARSAEWPTAISPQSPRIMQAQ